MAAKILVVDDDPNVQRLLQYTLKQEGYEVVVAADGAEGFRLWGAEAPDLILLDVHAAQARRLPGRDQDPDRGGRARPRPDHHADRRARGRAEGPRPAGRRRRLPDQAVPPGRAAGPDQEPARPLRAEGRRCWHGRRSAGSSRSTAPRAASARRPSRSTRRSRCTASSGARSASSTATSSSATTASSSTSGLDRKSIVDVVSAPSIDARPHPPGPGQARLGDRPAARAAVARRPPSSSGPSTCRYIAEQLADVVRLHPDRHRQAPRRRQPRRLRGRRTRLRGHDRRPVVPQERAAHPRDRSTTSATRRRKVQLVLNRSNAFTGINVKNAEGALRRTIDHQIVNEYRGAISALNSGAPFMFTKADSALGGSLLQFARAVDKPAGSRRGGGRPLAPSVRRGPTRAGGG